jgi:hypothetical protein
MTDKDVQEKDEGIIATFPKNEREVIKVRKSTFKGKDYVDIRTYVITEDGTEIPTKKGVNVPIDLVDELKKAVAKI